MRLLTNIYCFVTVYDTSVDLKCSSSIVEYTCPSVLKKSRASLH